MKKLVIALAMVAAGLNVFGQGQLMFNNYSSTRGVNGLVWEDQVTTGTLLSGTDWKAALYGGPSGSVGADLSGNLGTMSLLGNPNNPSLTVVNFQTGTSAGRVLVGAQGGRIIPTVAYNGTASVQIRVWSATAGNTWEEAYAAWQAAPKGTYKIGVSSVVTSPVTTSSTDTALPWLTALQPFAVVAVPEPSAVLLGALALVGAFVIRRRK